ncbi:TetR/AcrR family transcriptional regulator [Flavobacterium sp. RHBU_3]|uniref:TetR/AcrR family transcriptional regulator n=1 Tax=Flavobacterium sp. RHBU_3 TaxID=3391184 RepID=UPI003984BF90
MTKAEKTKQFIIEKTAPVFNRKGYAGTSISDLTEATGLTKGSIYGNFENKDEVALAAFDYNYRRVVNRISERLGGKHTSAIDKLKAYISVYAEMPKDAILQYGCPVLNTATEADDTHPELRKRAQMAVQMWKRNVESIVKEGQEQKQIRKSVDAAEFAYGFIAVIEGGVMLWKLTGHNDVMNAALKVAKRMVNDVAK